MLRLIGILIGSALAVAFLVLTLGVPQLAAPESRPDLEPELAPDIVQASLLTNDTEPEPEPERERAPEPEPEPEPEHDGTSSLANDSDTLIEEIFAPEPEPIASAPSGTPAPVVEENWYAFWSPFRSEIAASGFINKLQATTGIDYRVVKIKTGVYEVAFAYVDDADIQDKLARISSATGLDMTGG